MSAISTALAARDLHLLASPLGPQAHDPVAVAAAWGLLSPDERERAMSRRSELLRRDYIVGRGMLRVLLARYLADTPPHALCFITSPHGKPRLDPQVHAGAPAYSVSHCANLLLVGVVQAGHDFGLDVEPMRAAPIDDTLAAEVLALREHAVYLAAPPSRRAAIFLASWTRKEAYLKAVGTGLIDDLCQIDTSQDEVRVAGAPTGFFCRELPVGRGFRAAFASRDPLEVVRLSPVPGWPAGADA